MTRIWIAPLLLAASAATAQVGVDVAGAVNGSLQGANSAVGGLSDIPVTNRAPTDLIRGAQDATTSRGAGEIARDAQGGVAGGAGKSVQVRGEASVRVARGTRCWYEPDSYYDPVYRDGSYYCERTGPGVAAGARVR